MIASNRWRSGLCRKCRWACESRIGNDAMRDDICGMLIPMPPQASVWEVPARCTGASGRFARGKRQLHTVRAKNPPREQLARRVKCDHLKDSQTAP
jgi:hypothetical protein